MAQQVPPSFKSLDDYDKALFIQDDASFSSSTYRIDAIRLLHKVFIASKGGSMDGQLVDIADLHLTNWWLHLPPSKRVSVDRDCNADEVLFEAHMIAYA